MKHFLFAVVLLVAALPAVGAEKFVFLGDSITAADVWTKLVCQSLAAADPKDAPTCVNAGVGGNTAAAMLKRLERDVLSKKPTLVTLSAGINDSRLKVSDEAFERDVTAIADRVTRSGAKLVVLTTTVLGKGREDRAVRTETYDRILRKVAAAHEAPVAEAKTLMAAARDKGEVLLNDDQVHPNLAGHRIIARAVLDALGHKDLAVPQDVKR